MDDSVIAAIARWPDVPHVYGWLSLDRRGRWRVQGSPVTNPRIADFIGRNYAHDERGAWFFQNGPQRVYVALDYTPWVLRIGDRTTLLTHTAIPVRATSSALLDEHGNLLLAFDGSVGLVEDRDLPALVHALHDDMGNPADEETLTRALAGEALPLTLHWDMLRLPLLPVRSSDIPARFGFIVDPRP